MVTQDRVATLASGFTLNSLQGGIANNQWTPTPVPLPSTLWMLASGAMFLRAQRRQRA